MTIRQRVEELAPCGGVSVEEGSSDPGGRCWNGSARLVSSGRSAKLRSWPAMSGPAGTARVRCWSGRACSRR